jgi:hypothetical protein
MVIELPVQKTKGFSINLKENISSTLELDCDRFHKPTDSLLDERCVFI